jgi:hypothetical protein
MVAPDIDFMQIYANYNYLLNFLLFVTIILKFLSEENILSLAFISLPLGHCRPRRPPRAPPPPRLRPSSVPHGGCFEKNT